ncbi:hypothetical protein M407DRAFT_191093 [Tulasnella calospora MUT 4182]|uniref:Uncharacterized protein n=1 Tax=Tulasnella calospora MUT 4182 TaxID=1051891 RepID=A0A0C3QAR0_9AGAM|nr:hypothetical protein M407DRAFT_191093 [Tulasnella calospora MUT 4182]
MIRPVFLRRDVCGFHVDFFPSSPSPSPLLLRVPRSCPSLSFSFFFGSYVVPVLPSCPVLYTLSAVLSPPLRHISLVHILYIVTFPTPYPPSYHHHHPSLSSLPGYFIRLFRHHGFSLSRSAIWVACFLFLLLVGLVVFFVFPLLSPSRSFFFFAHRSWIRPHDQSRTCIHT